MTVKAAGLLGELFDRPDPLAEINPQITAIEHEADEITRATVTRLRSQWITPLDRPDIHLLATRLDDVTDAIEVIAERMQLFQLRESSQVACDAARVLEESAIKVAQAVDMLPEACARTWPTRSRAWCWSTPDAGLC